jgi:hypothetical protein
MQSQVTSSETAKVGNSGSIRDCRKGVVAIVAVGVVFIYFFSVWLHSIVGFSLAQLDWMATFYKSYHLSRDSIFRRDLQMIKPAGILGNHGKIMLLPYIGSPSISTRENTPPK